MLEQRSVGARQLVTLKDAARYLGVDILTVRRRIARGELVGYRIGSGPRAPIRVDLAQIDDALLRPIPSDGGGDRAE